MPLFFQQNINEQSTLAIWCIEEEESFFLESVAMHPSISNPLKRKQHLAGRYLLKALDPLFPVEQIKIADSRKPFLEEDLYYFSISHSGSYAAAIISAEQQVGVDVEVYSGKVLRVLNKFLSEEEQALMLPFFENEYVLETLLWSVKEAVYKWYGSGPVDFKEHMRIHSIQNSAQNRFVVEVLCYEQYLTVQGICFSDFCLTWVIA